MKFIEKASQPPNKETRDFYENEKWKDTDRIPDGAEIIVGKNILEE